VTSEEHFCPECGHRRTGFFRFCGQCGLDFDSVPVVSEEPVLTAAPTIAAPPPSPIPRTEPVDPGAINVGGWKPPRPVSIRPSRSALRYATIGVVALLGLGAISNLTTSPSGAPVPSAALASTAPKSTSTPKPSPTFGPTGPTRLASVTKVVDGDTIRVLIGGVEYPVRYIGIDSPEPDATDPLTKQLAAAATAANAELVGGREVLLERDISETDQFDRLLMHVWLIDAGPPILVNAELVRRGFAEVTTYPPDEKYVALLTAAQQSASTSALGLWAPVPTPSPTPTPIPTQAPVAEIDDSFYEIASESRTAFRGLVGQYTYTALAFPLDRATVRWNVTAARGQACRLAWRIEPGSGNVIRSTVRVDAGKKESGSRRYATPFSQGMFIADSTCAGWTMSLQGIEVSGGGGADCDSSYPDVCIPPFPPDLDCPDISYRRFEVRGSDPHGFDGDNDGVGCESG
jgi:endonuclease YncB( thermonuclease family)